MKESHFPQQNFLLNVIRIFNAQLAMKYKITRELIKEKKEKMKCI